MNTTSSNTIHTASTVTAASASSAANPSNAPCTVSIIIKALNEEKRIATAIESALQAAAVVGGEVILADSYSTDRTIEIAQNYPITIMQLANPSERCCGIGPQLGYQVAKGEFVYILDGDMQMLPDFLPKAIEFMHSIPQAAGVGGKVLEMNVQSLEFLARVERAAHHMQPGLVDRLDMGGLYRKSAIESVGYFSNRNLHSYEELDLAVRLRAQNWQLYRIEANAVRHWGHDAPPYSLLLKRWKTGYINGLGEVLRASLGQPHLKLLLKDVKELRIYLATIAWWLVLASLLIAPLTLANSLAVFGTLFGALLLAPFVLMALRKKSLTKALYSIVSWNVNAAGLIRGFLKSSTNIKEPINALSRNI